MAREAAYPRRAGVIATKQSTGHGLAIWVINETKAFKISPALNALTGRYYQFQWFLCETTHTQTRIVRFERHQSKFKAVVQHGIEYFTIRRETLSNAQAWVGML